MRVGGGGGGAIPADIGREAIPNTHTHTITLTVNLESAIDLTLNLHVCGLWEEAGVAGENTHGEKDPAQAETRIKPGTFLFWGDCSSFT